MARSLSMSCATIISLTTVFFSRPKQTSMIKALAHATGRSIVNVPLSRISTNAELQSIIFDKRYCVQNEGLLTLTLDFKDVIFVMEDVDAASDIVKRRKQEDATDSTTGNNRATLIHVPKQPSIWSMLVQSNDGEARKLVQLLVERSHRLKQESNTGLQESAQRLLSVPGLAAVGNPNKDMQILGDRSIQDASKLLQQYVVVDKFIAAHARTIRGHLEAGAEVDDAFVSALLGEQQATVAIQDEAANDPAQDVNDPADDDATVVTNTNNNGQQQQQRQLLASISHMLDSRARAAASMGGGSNNGTPSAASAVPAGFGLYGGDSGGDEDKLSLSGLLNVLDGVVDSPGRIVIMTTNHPELLDPALIRPGRIDKKLLLGTMAAADVISMLQHYFVAEAPLSETHKRRVQVCMDGSDDDTGGGLKHTPAQVEQMIVEHEILTDMISALEERKHGPAVSDGGAQ